MNSTMNALPAPQHQADPVRSASHDRRGHGEPRTRGYAAPTRWISLAHAALNQAKLAAPRTAGVPSRSSVPYGPDRGKIVLQSPQADRRAVIPYI
jgi:hypothetical protein